MCGIVGAIAQRDVDLILLEGLRRLEYRGYDSAGLVLVDDQAHMQRLRRVGKVQALADALEAQPLKGHVGLAHTRWATHGAPTQSNAHPHLSHGRLAVVHNGIIENFEELREELVASGVAIETETDTEVTAHLIHRYLIDGADLLTAVQRAVKRLHGAYALAVIDREHPSNIVAARLGSPLVVGIGLGEHFLASDVSALLPVTQRFVYLAEGDVAILTQDAYRIFDRDDGRVERPVITSTLSADAADKGLYRHHMQKEIHEQPEALARTLEGRISSASVLPATFGHAAMAAFKQTKAVHIVACGTSLHAGLVARYWIEAMARLPCSVEIASEFRYRTPAVPQGTLLVTISQSGETADTLAALRAAKTMDYVATMGICNVPESSLVREADLLLMTRAGVEVGVASTKAFTTQLCALMLLAIALAKFRGLKAQQEATLVQELAALPGRVVEVLAIEDRIARLAEDFVEKEHALFLGRGPEFPIAMEGALKLKEVSYIHAEAYAAGELKHGPLALVDDSLPVVVSAASNDLLAKLVSNLQEVRARGGQLYLFVDRGAKVPTSDQIHVLELPVDNGPLSPLLHVIPLQLLAYHVAVLRGTDVDQPRNLAKSVTVE